MGFFRRKDIRCENLIAENIHTHAGGTPAIAGLSSTETEVLNGVTPGTGAVSKALVLDSGGDIIMPSTGLFGLSRGTLAALGSTAADAAVITQQVTLVTASNGTKAVALPAAATTIGPLLVVNTVLTTGATLPVFPTNGGNDNINGGAEDAAFTMGPGKAAWFIPTSATQWYVEDASANTAITSELNTLTGATAGTVVASKATVASADKDLGDFRNHDAINYDAGSSGVAGTVDVFPATASKGKLVLAAVNNDGDTATTISNAAMGQGSVISIPDPGAATANFLLTSQANDQVLVAATAAEINTAADQSAQVLTAGAGITGAGTKYKTSIEKKGDIFKTTIFLDLTDLASSTTADDIIGTAGVCHLGQITAAKNGTLYYGQITCLETPAGGDPDIDFWSATEDTGAYDALVTDLTEVIMRANAGNWTGAPQTPVIFTNLPAADKYMYMAVGSAGGAPGTYSAGQFLIELYGF